MNQKKRHVDLNFRLLIGAEQHRFQREAQRQKFGKWESNRFVPTGWLQLWVRVSKAPLRTSGVFRIVGLILLPPAAGLLLDQAL